LTDLESITVTDIPEESTTSIGTAEAQQSMDEEIEDFYATNYTFPLNSGTRVLGGTGITLGQYPFFVVVNATARDGSISVCGGVLLSESYVLTTANCTAM
jgi:hypothetical protein